MGQPVVHFQIGCRDRGKTAAFFSQLFGWNTQEAGPATMIDTGAKAGIHGHITALGHEPHHYVTVYVQVDDVQAYLDNAKS
jgi:predicted enzyme related to lactoylglutathione lyase